MRKVRLLRDLDVYDINSDFTLRSAGYYIPRGRIITILTYATQVVIAAKSDKKEGVTPFYDEFFDLNTEVLMYFRDADVINEKGEVDAWEDIS